MNENAADSIAAEAAGLGAEALLELATRHFGKRAAFASSLGAEDQVITDMIARASLPIAIFTLDTGRLPQETYDVLESTRRHYGLEIEVLFPSPGDIEPEVTRRGPNFFRDSIDGRKLCCHIRKVLPLRRRLTGLEAWITGLRRGQAITRGELRSVQWDEANGLVKISPLANWSDEQVWDYIRRRGVPYNKLHDAGYPSIGCACCTRAVAPGQDIRSGRWWWEQPEHKECGLHRPAAR